MQPEIKDWARLAAFIDGEGHLGLTCKNQTTQKGNRRIRIKVAEIRIANTDVRLMDWLQSVFGGKVRVQKLREGHRRPCFSWIAGHADIDSLLRGCLEYFVMKREQAEIILSFRALVQRKAWKGEKVSEEEHLVRQQMADRIHVLNARGPVEKAS